MRKPLRGAALAAHNRKMSRQCPPFPEDEWCEEGFNIEVYPLLDRMLQMLCARQLVPLAIVCVCCIMLGPIAGPVLAILYCASMIWAHDSASARYRDWLEIEIEAYNEEEEVCGDQEDGCTVGPKAS